MQRYHQGYEAIKGKLEAAITKQYVNVSKLAEGEIAAVGSDADKQKKSEDSDNSGWDESCNPHNYEHYIFVILLCNMIRSWMIRDTLNYRMGKCMGGEGRSSSRETQLEPNLVDNDPNIVDYVTISAKIWQ